MHHQQQLQQNNKNLLNAPAKEEFINFSCLFFSPPKDVIENEVSGRAVKKKKERKKRKTGRRKFFNGKNRLKCYHAVLASRVHPMMVSHALKENYS